MNKYADDKRFTTLLAVIRVPREEFEAHVERGDMGLAIDPDEVMFFSTQEGITDQAITLGAEPGDWADDEDDDTLYEKCAECHLFIEPNDIPDAEYDRDLAEYVHLHRGDEADEAIDATHEAKPSGQIATLRTWKAFGPPEMKARFTS